MTFLTKPERRTYWNSQEDAMSFAAESIVLCIDKIKDRKDQRSILNHIAKGKFLEAMMVWNASKKQDFLPHTIIVVDQTINKFDNNRYYELRCKAVAQLQEDKKHEKAEAVVQTSKENS